MGSHWSHRSAVNISSIKQLFDSPNLPCQDSPIPSHGWRSWFPLGLPESRLRVSPSHCHTLPNHLAMAMATAAVQRVEAGIGKCAHHLGALQGESRRLSFKHRFGICFMRFDDVVWSIHDYYYGLLTLFHSKKKRSKLSLWVDAHAESQATNGSVNLSRWRNRILGNLRWEGEHLLPATLPSSPWNHVLRLFGRRAALHDNETQG